MRRRQVRNTERFVQVQKYGIIRNRLGAATFKCRKQYVIPSDITRIAVNVVGVKCRQCSSSGNELPSSRILLRGLHLLITWQIILSGSSAIELAWTVHDRLPQIPIQSKRVILKPASSHHNEGYPSPDTCIFTLMETADQGRTACSVVFR